MSYGSVCGSSLVATRSICLSLAAAYQALACQSRDLLNLIILSAITETKSKEITQRIRVVLHRYRFDDLDLRDVRQHWKE